VNGAVSVVIGVHVRRNHWPNFRWAQAAWRVEEVCLGDAGGPSALTDGAKVHSLWVGYSEAGSGLIVAGLGEAGPGSATPATRVPAPMPRSLLQGSLLTPAPFSNISSEIYRTVFVGPS
jgi:hypothetical protein